jgi:predicted Ser/Thr protein kinase
LGEKNKKDFKSLLLNHGYNEKAADALWQWYDHTNKKGVASF